MRQWHESDHSPPPSVDDSNEQSGSSALRYVFLKSTLVVLLSQVMLARDWHQVV